MGRFDFQDSREMVEILIAAEDEITPYLRSHDGNVINDDQGDLTLGIENRYPVMLGEYLSKKGIHAILISEGSVLLQFADNDNIITFLDPFEASTNFHSGRLPYGVNVAVFPDSDGDVLVSDWVAALVTDRRSSIKYAAYKEKNDNHAFVVDHGRRRPPKGGRGGPIIEIPAGYTKRDESFFNQMAYYLAIKDALDDNQYRSVDATGTELASVADGSTRVYVEGRNLKKLGGAWNIIPSAIIINAAGGKATHLNGEEFWGDVVWNQSKFDKTGGYNPDVGRDVLATSDPAEHDICLGALRPVIGKEARYLIKRIGNSY